MNNKIKLRTPGYYKNFHCISSECKDNCCVGGWQIDIDEETAEYYSTVNGDFGKKLRDNIDYDNLCFKLKDGKCPFLDNNNLCGIYKELGEEHIGIVCDQFPRFTEYFGNVKERGIGLACEEAAKNNFNGPAAIFLIQKQIPTKMSLMTVNLTAVLQICLCCYVTNLCM